MSADGRYVAFLRGDLSDENARFEWFVLDRACLPACDARPLLPDGGILHGLRWSPVGPQIIAEGAANDIWLIDVELASAEQLIGGDWHVSPAWSSDGAWIIMSSDQVAGPVESDDIQIMPVEGGDLINLTYSGEWIEETDPTFSPDGQWIAYTTYALFTDDLDPFYPSPFSLIVIDAACIDDAPDACLESRRALNLTDQAVGEYVWSPDSQYIAYTEGDPLGLTDASAVWIVEIATGDAWQLSAGPSDTHLAWMPDSSAIMFNRSGSGSLDIYWVPVDGSLEPDIMLKGFLASADVYWAPQH